MKPLLLEFEAFGPYVDRVSVDFNVLAARGLFVVTGKTGSGKTAIFDAMSFALFGKMPMKVHSEIRSHHASPDQKTQVAFTFEIDGRTFVVERSPEYERPRKVGEGTTKEGAKALLVEIGSDGSTQELATQIKTVNDRCKKLVGLSDEQFQRVMLLPQGEVTEFLLASSSDREELLQRLFGGEIFDRIVDALKRQSDEAKAEVAEADEDLRHHLRAAVGQVDSLHQLLGQPGLGDSDELSRDQLGSLINDVEPAKTAAESAAKNAEANATDASDVQRSAQAENKRFADAKEYEETLAELDKAQPIIKRRAEAAKASQRARPAVAAAIAVDKRETLLRKAEDELIRRNAALSAEASSFGVELDTRTTASATRSVTELHATVDKAETALSAASSAMETVDEAKGALATNKHRAEQARSSAAELKTLISQFDEQLNELAGLQDDVQELTLELEGLTAAEELARDRDAILESLSVQEGELEISATGVDAMWHRFVETQRVRLAKELKRDIACPVCGSFEHPNPAIADGGNPVENSDLEQARAEHKKISEVVNKLKQDLAERRGELGEHANTPVDGLNTLISQTDIGLTALVAKTTDAENLEQKKTTAQENQAQAESEADRLNGAQDQLTQDLQRVSRELERAQTASVGLDSVVVSGQREGVNRLSELLQGLDELHSALASATSVKQVTEATLARELAESGFDDLVSARAALQDRADEAIALEAEDTADSDRQTARTKLGLLRDQGVPDQAHDLELLNETVRATRHRAENCREIATNATSALQAANDHLSDHDRVGIDSYALRQRSEEAHRAHAVNSGKGSVRTSLRQWVLGQELDRVTEAASVHLRQMSKGRYSITRKLKSDTPRSPLGLNLEVLDSNTGLKRSPKSLSGGEQFQASLALALGLADIASHGTIDRSYKLEALFIDEGFGTLDSEALDEAIETLHHLQASGRTVGIITHVEALKERLHTGIEVLPHPDGKGSTLKINP
ncbi:MAG: SMC family ATPase [Acidimicrobiaceae bacterium]|nr:SMC family ATPase [Acidimicrobiaceae bacterium]